MTQQSLPSPLRDGDHVSSAFTSLLKWSPIVWLGGAIPAVSVGIGTLLQQNPINYYAVGTLTCIVLFVALLGFVIIRTVWSCADEVILREDGLSVRRGATRVQVPWESITKKSYIWGMNPPLITLQLKQPTDLGDKISFFGLSVLAGFGLHPKNRALLSHIESNLTKP